MYTLFYNGHIHTGVEAQPYCRTVLMQSDRIIFCGDDQDINIPNKLISKVDLKNAHVYPGFIDCHTHIATAALSKERIILNECDSLSSALTKIKSHVVRIPHDSWILGGGWDANKWHDGKPNKEHLDAISKNHPIALYSKDYHSQWLNSVALNLCTFSKNTNDPPGGKIERDEHGEPSGIVYEQACTVVANISENISYAQVESGLKSISDYLFSLGITSVHSCESLEIFKIMQKLHLDKKLQLRICMHPPAADVDKFVDAGITSGYGNEWLRIGGIKYFMDGSLGSQTAEMFESFDNLNHAGFAVLTETELSEKIFYAAENGLSATIHAIGDKANHKTLNAIENWIKNKKRSTKFPLRHRIEHAQILAKSDISRFSKLGVIASVQPIHIADDVKIAHRYLGKRAGNAYPFKSLLNSNCRLVFGSDMPIADPSPLKGILAASCRKYNLNTQEPPWNKSECITAKQAVFAYTRDAAYASYEEDIKGIISPGKLADLVVLSENLYDADETLVRATNVLMTIIGGKIVYRADSI